MKSLSIKQILITILVSYLITAYVNSELNPFNLGVEAKVIQIFIITISLGVQLGIKNSF
jgi:hypothetical protein